GPLIFKSQRGDNCVDNVANDNDDSNSKKPVALGGRTHPYTVTAQANAYMHRYVLYIPQRCLARNSPYSTPIQAKKNSYGKHKRRRRSNCLGLLFACVFAAVDGNCVGA
ncbi:unnamed protein product, partial [Ceratitis capitata]